jgi:hypothetical protein
MSLLGIYEVPSTRFLYQVNIISKMNNIISIDHFTQMCKTLSKIRQNGPELLSSRNQWPALPSSILNFKYKMKPIQNAT